jgi:hypothetical protein
MTGNQAGGTWRDALVERDPDLFKVGADHRIPGRPTVDDGWQDLVERAVTRIAAAVSRAPAGCLRIMQIKEKIGTLRLYKRAGAGFTDAMSDAVQEAIDQAEARSACTCQRCGEPGRLFRDAGVYQTACDVHGRGSPVSVRPGRENLHLRHFTIRASASVVRLRRYIRETDSFVDVDPSSVPPEEDQAMARFRCRACSSEGTFEYKGGHACPNCVWRDVQLAVAIEELADDDPLIVALTKVADDSTE